MMKGFFGAFVFILLFSLGKKAEAQPISNGELKWLDMVRDSRADSVSFQYVQLSGEISLQLGGSMQSAQMVIRMKNDSCIWATVRVLGLEAIRGMVTRDSVWVINRLNKTYSVRSISEFTRSLGIEARLFALQQQLFGRLSELPGFLTYQSVSKPDSNQTQYQGKFSYKMADSSIQKSVALVANDSLQWQNIRVQQDSSLFVLSYKNYQKQAEGEFPWKIEARKNEEVEPLFQLIYTKIEFKNFETFPFKIPESYLRVDER
jgi:hypothetical protein